MSASTVPLPLPTAISAPFWAGCQREELLVQRCRDCGAFVHIPEPCCSRCTSFALEWVRSSGRGIVYSYSVVWRPQQPAFAVPYVAAIVELEEGWKTLTNIIECAPADVCVGLAVEVSFRRMSDEITLPYFRPRGVPAEEES